MSSREIDFPLKPTGENKKHLEQMDDRRPGKSGLDLAQWRVEALLKEKKKDKKRLVV